MTATTPPASPRQRPRPNQTSGHKVRELLGHLRQQPGLDYLLLRIVIFLLIGIGVVMVFSSSMATSLTDDGNFWGQAVRQCLMVVVGLVAFWVMLRISPYALRKMVPILVVAAIALLIAVLIPGVGTGREEVGSQSWIILGPLSLQPSEFARVVIGIYGATALTQSRQRRDLRFPPMAVYSAVAGFMMILILLQGDVGMTMSFGMVYVLAMMLAGAGRGFFLAMGAAAMAMLAILLLGGGFRTHRFHTYFDALVGNIEDTQGTGFQAYQGFLSLADGGFGGVGLGQSRAKWFYLPEAKNDFIFAIVGEELGLWGGALVILLFAALAWLGLRSARRAQDQFQSLLAATLSLGVVTQAFFNIGYVVGLLPVTGIQLPMISAGGTAAIITIGSMGILCNVARHEPEQISAMQNFGRPLFDRVLMIPEPQPNGKSARKTGRHAAPAKSNSPGGGFALPGRGKREQFRQERFGRPVTGRSAREDGAPQRLDRGRPRAGQEPTRLHGRGRGPNPRGRGER